MLEEQRFRGRGDRQAVDTFGGAKGEGNARAFEVYGYPFLARKPD